MEKLYAWFAGRSKKELILVLVAIAIAYSIFFG